MNRLAGPLQTRRDFLTCCGGAGLGVYPALSLAASSRGAEVLAPRSGHFPAKAKNLIVIFLTGGFSHVDTFDPKPRLQKDHGKKLFGRSLRDAADKPFYALGSPFQFKPCGKSGIMVSELFPHLGALADRLCVIRTLHTDIVEHFQATLAMHTGSATVPMPSIGCWLSYGLGTGNKNLPPYVVLAEHMPYAGAQVWDCGFLPAYHQGVRVIPGPEPIPDLRSPARTSSLAELEQAMLRDVNEMHSRERPNDLNLAARSRSFATARGMMGEATRLFDLSAETQGTLEMYGCRRGDNHSFAWQCLMSRRLLECGVRVVELIDTGSNNNWDAHGNMQDHRPKAQRVDRAIAALLQDLAQRGLLDETLLAICTEFGRTPYGTSPNDKGRNHLAQAFTCLLAGAGVKGGTTYGETDEYGMHIAANPCHVHDYHATILHLLGIDHTRLTYRYAGRDFRLTDVHGAVLKPVLA